MAGVPTLYDLTPLTRDASAKRRVVVQGWDIDRRIFVLCLIGLLPAGLAGILAHQVIGSYAIFVIAAVYAPIFWLFLGKTSKGLELANWRHLKTKRESNDGYFMLRGQRMDPDRHEPRVLRSASRPGPGLLARPTGPVLDTDDLFA